MVNKKGGLKTAFFYVLLCPSFGAFYILAFGCPQNILLAITKHRICPLKKHAKKYYRSILGLKLNYRHRADKERGLPGDA
ncbi:hypothetical protein [Pelobium manganitolerans]|uniref:hypothetical protein n=1 Tax=Pelobium manganitolerans TaxID=1842495 RepID=UPI001600FFE0|nr:hypothetical protein [Pelobium manganitolerans]